MFKNINFIQFKRKAIIFILIIGFSLIVTNTVSATELQNNNVTVGDEPSTEIIVGTAPSYYVKDFSKESKNVILSGSISPSVDPHLGGVYEVWVNLELRYKGTNTPIPYGKIYVIAGEDKFTLKTNKNGNVNDYIYSPVKIGNKKLIFKFKGLKTKINGSTVYLKPLTAKSSYFFSYPDYYKSLKIIYDENIYKKNKYKILSINFRNIMNKKVSKSFKIYLDDYYEFYNYKTSHIKYTKSSLNYDRKTKIIKINFKNLPPYNSKKDFGKLIIYFKKK